MAQQGFYRSRLSRIMFQGAREKELSPESGSLGGKWASFNGMLCWFSSRGHSLFLVCPSISCFFLYAFFTLRIGLSAVRLAKNLFMVILFFQTELLYHTVLYSSIRRFKGVGKVILGFLWATRVTSLLVQWC